MKKSYAAAAAIALFSGTVGAQTAVVQGQVADLIENRMLADAIVQLERVSDAHVLETRTDSLGKFRIERVPYGAYRIGFFHPTLEDLAIDVAPRPLTVGDSIVGVALATPAPASVLAATCPRNSLPDSSGLLVGRVVDAESDGPIPNATVQVSWFEVVIDKGLHEERRVATARATENGLFGLCGIPTDGSLSLTATADSASTPPLEVAAPASRVLRRRLAISHSNRTVRVDDSSSVAPLLRGTATLRGRVANADRRPVVGAAVTVRGTGLETKTDAQGEFRLAELPGGTQTLDVRAIGYSPQASPVNLRNGAEERASLVLTTRTPVLDAVRVVGKAEESAFLRRMHRGMGRFITAADIERRDPIDITSIFRTMPGMRVVLAPTGYALRYVSGVASVGAMGPVGCAPTIYLNGAKLFSGDDLDMMVNPRTVRGIEVYGPHEAPLQYQSTCASIVIWDGMTPK